MIFTVERIVYRCRLVVPELATRGGVSREVPRRYEIISISERVVYILELKEHFGLVKAENMTRADTYGNNISGDSIL